MKKIGLDFGTTNSTLSYIDPQRQVPECYRMRSAAGSPYIPSYIRYDTTDGTVEIGRGAKKSINDEDYEVYANFKMLLGENNREKLESFGYFDKTPAECAADYISALLAEFRREHRLEYIDEIVATAPEIWIKEHNHKSRERLKAIFTDNNLPLQRFLSEPVAALAYFVHCYRLKMHKPFSGYALVCDYGGGTLDMTLSRVSGEAIKVLECTGKGEAPLSIGKAGVAYDEAMVRNVFEREKGTPLYRSDPLFLYLADLFEEHKIDRKADVDKALSQYLKMNTVNKKAFKIDELAFCASDFIETFDRIIRPELINALDSMRHYIQAYPIDPLDQEKFKVILAGGFSGFYLTRKTIMDYFQARQPDDPRFDACFSVEDTALAIAKGAALVAQNMIAVDQTCPISLGLRVKSDSEGILKDMDAPVLLKGVSIQDYKQPVFLPDPVRINTDHQGGAPVVVFLGDGEARCRIHLDKEIHQLFPGLGAQRRLWRVGFSVDDNLCFTIHTEDDQGTRYETLLGDLLSKVSGLILTPQGNQS